MICGKCKKTKDNLEFTKLNISKDGKTGLCKECKKERNYINKSKKRTNDALLEYFELTGDLLEKPNARIGFLKLYKFTDRKTTKNKEFEELPNIGANAILSELTEPYEICFIESINKYEIILISLMSVMDIENLIYTFERFAPKEIKPIIIIGGFGVCNIKLIVNYIDVAVWGRAEGQINGIIAGEEYRNVWRKDKDPNIKGSYVVRQPRYLVPGEVSVGCRNNCSYCQYTNIRKPLNNGEIYNPGTNYSNAIESDWNGLSITKPGIYTSAWDGWSDYTRHRVHKPVTNKSITDKVIGISNKGFGGGVAIKVFQIVGYPWETKESVLKDIQDTYKMLIDISSQLKSRIVLTFMITPFGPEPLTPMANDRADIQTDWHEVIKGVKKYDDGMLCLAMIPSVSGPYALVKRMLIHRAEIKDIDRYKSIVYSSRLNGMKNNIKVAWLLKHKIINENEFKEWDRKAIEYLSVE